MTPLATRIAKRADALPRADDRVRLRRKAAVTDALYLQVLMSKADAAARGEIQQQRRDSREGRG